MSWQTSYDDWITGGAMAGTVEPKCVGSCPVCGDDVTDNYIYWKDENAGEVICDNCIDAYLAEFYSIRQVG